MSAFIKLGSKTAHGGTVVTASSGLYDDNDVPYATTDDEVSCPKHGRQKIKGTSSVFGVNDQALAVDGDKTSCGDVLIANQNTSGVE